MTTIEIVQIILFFGLGIALTPIVGKFMYKVYSGQKTFLHPIFGPIERLIYRLTGCDPEHEMTWLQYFWAVLLFATVGFVADMAIFMTQKWLPLNPQHLDNCSWHLAFMQAWSFTCNADWQSYAGETTMSYFSQIFAIMVHQFLSGASGLAVLVAVGRALKRASTKTVGNFWTDLTRGLLYFVIPLSFVWAIPLAWQGLPQTLKPYQTANLVEPYTTQVQKTDDQGNLVTTNIQLVVQGPKLDVNGKQVMENGAVVMVDIPQVDAKGAPIMTNAPVMVDAKVETQPIPLGAVASFESIKQLFTNGGGWYNVNSSHPYENPTPFSNFWEMLAIIIVPMAQVYMFGLLVGNKKHAWCLFSVMFALYLLSFAGAWYFETRPNPVVANVMPNMEGKEQRIGVMNSVLWATSCTAIDNGSVNSMHDSYQPLAGMMPMWNILIGEMLFGGIGCGMYCMLFHVLITVFIAGLMIGRTPEYLGKKLDAWCATWAVIGVLIPNAAALIPTAIAVMIPQGLSSMNNGGPHGLSEVLYCFGEAANNNGSAFAGLNANTPFYNVGAGIVIWIGRFIPIIAALAIVGRLASKKTVEASSGTLPTHGWTFGLTLTGVIIIVAALTFFPALCLGPMVEHGLMLAGRAF
ncbi:MAG TPA: potassium-transporting ATPase subunit KdpA [Verrucomicrobiae bacterium]|nr:potassium-transporting ATPase subunit KdpA [Verrucomicrobiae bacterium]